MRDFVHVTQSHDEIVLTFDGTSLDLADELLMTIYNDGARSGYTRSAALVTSGVAAMQRTGSGCTQSGSPRLLQPSDAL